MTMWYIIMTHVLSLILREYIDSLFNTTSPKGVQQIITGPSDVVIIFILITVCHQSYKNDSKILV